MSTYGNEPPENPYGQTPPPPPPPPPPYGSPPAQPGYGYGAQPGYGAPAAYGGYGGYGAPAYDYASWGKRVAATLIDGLLTILAAFPIVIGYIILFAGAETTTTPDGTTTLTTGSVSPVAIILILLGVLTYLGFLVWNTFIKQGRTGYTIGKGVMGIKLVKEDTGQPVGAGIAFVRQVCHVLDSFCYVGYLWPLWDAKRQTFADKIMTTVVHNAPKT